MMTSSATSNLVVNDVIYAIKNNEYLGAEGYLPSVSSLVMFRSQLEISGKSLRLKVVSNFRNWNGFRACIPACVETIEDEAFHKCECMTGIDFAPDASLRVIGNAAFEFSGLKCIKIPAHIEEIRPLCFHGCGDLEKLFFEDGTTLKAIRQEAFRGCGLVSVLFPATLEVIEESAFLNCKSLTEIIFDLSSALREIGKGAFMGCGIRSLSIPPLLENIGLLCFCGCESLTTVNFGPNSSLKVLEPMAFQGCGFDALTIPQNIKVIGEKCFFGCRRLKKIMFKGATTIGSRAFEGAPVTLVKVLEGYQVSYPFGEGCRTAVVRDEYEEVKGEE
jgi:hypothetical protein